MISTKEISVVGREPIDFCKKKKIEAMMGIRDDSPNSLMRHRISTGRSIRQTFQPLCDQDSLKLLI